MARLKVVELHAWWLDRASTQASCISVDSQQEGSHRIPTYPEKCYTEWLLPSGYDVFLGLGLKCTMSIHSDSYSLSLAFSFICVTGGRLFFILSVLPSHESGCRFWVAKHKKRKKPLKFLNRWSSKKKKKKKKEKVSLEGGADVRNKNLCILIHYTWLTWLCVLISITELNISMAHGSYS